MDRVDLWLPVALVALCLNPALAQEPGLAVQLPTFSHFSVGTTVLVPDRGSAFMGGIGRSVSGRSTFGTPLLPFRPFRNTAIGTGHGAMSTHVSVWIHDFQAMDEYLLNQAPRTVRPGAGHVGLAATDRRPASLDPAWNPAGGIDSTWRAANGDRADPASGQQWQSASQPARPMPLLDVAEEQRRRQSLAETRSTEAEAFFLRGQEAEASGKANVARIYYQMAARRATGPLQNEVLARLRALAGQDSAGSLARSND